VPEPDAFHANLMRGSFLLDQDRPREALPFIRGAIAIDPHSAQAYGELARCWNDIPAERRKSIQAIDQAISFAPQVSYYFGRKGWYLVCLMNLRGALQAAQQGLALNPTCPQSRNALANAYTKLGRWTKAEAACRRILAVEPDDGPGLNLLAQALRHQGRWKESRETVARLLALMPDNAFGHANAGYAALAAGDHLRANEHFLEALRMNPPFDLARRGLLSSLRSRIWLLRLNRYLYLPGAWRNGVIAVAVLGTMLMLSQYGELLEKAYPRVADALGWSFFGGCLFYVFLSFLTLFVGNFLLLFDPLGRHAMNAREKGQAYLSAAGVAGLITLFFAVGSGAVGWAILGMLVLAGLMVLFPLVRDRWIRHREGSWAG
jgi:tetratricopeptide (TPR) repeat protein